jgi:hypothetical protein
VSTLGLDHNEAEITGAQPVPEGQPGLTFEDDSDAARLFDPAAMGSASIDALVSLLDKYMVPPFTILDRRQGYWQERARQWKGLGIESELGRAEGAKAFTTGHLAEGDYGKAFASTEVSIFDPVICEIAYHWFCPPGGLVLDPFAGGSVRGIVAAASGRRYVGVDLSGAQCVANRVQAERIIEDEDKRPAWIEGDALEVLHGYLGDMPDMLFTCPPYGDLEVYSDHPSDLSNMDAAGFAEAYAAIIHEAVFALRQDSFAVFVVGNYRNKKGHLHDLVGLTVRAFNAAGARFYNEAIILDPIGTAAVRAPRQFAAQRKLVRVHQQLLVFVKGDAKAATDKIRHENEAPAQAATPPPAADQPLSRNGRVMLEVLRNASPHAVDARELEDHKVHDHAELAQVLLAKEYPLDVGTDDGQAVYVLPPGA